MPFIPETVERLTDLAAVTPLGVRGCAAVAGGLLLVLGSRIYRIAIAVPGALAGMMVASRWGLGTPESTFMLMTAAGAALGGMAALALEQLAVRLAGGLLGAWVGVVAAPSLGYDGAELWLPAVGAGVGLFLFPRLYRTALLLLTPWLGAVALAYALGRPEEALLVAGLTVVGVVVQLFVTRPRPA